MMPQQKSENHSTTFLIPRQWPVLVAPFPSVVYLHIPFHLKSTIQIENEDPPCPSGTRRRRLWLWLGLFFTTSNLETSGRSSPLVSILLLPCLCVFLLHHLLRLYSIIIIIYLFRYSRCLDAYTIGEMLPFLCSNKLLLRLLLLLLCFSHTRHNSTSTGRIKSRCLIKQQRICHNKVGADDAFLGKSKRVSLLFSFKLQFHESHTNHQYTRAHREIELRDSH